MTSSILPIPTSFSFLRHSSATRSASAAAAWLLNLPISPQLQKNLLENPTKQQIKLFET